MVCMYSRIYHLQQYQEKIRTCDEFLELTEPDPYYSRVPSAQIGWRRIGLRMGWMAEVLWEWECRKAPKSIKASVDKPRITYKPDWTMTKTYKLPMSLEDWQCYLDTPQEVVDLINTYCEKALKRSKDPKSLCSTSTQFWITLWSSDWETQSVTTSRSE